MATFFKVALDKEVLSLNSNQRYFIVSIFMAGIIFSVCLFIFSKLLKSYYNRVWRNRRGKGEVSVNTERGEDENEV